MDLPRGDKGQVRRAERDVRGGLRMVRIEGFASRHIFIQDQERVISKSGSETSTPLVGRDRGFPRWMMSIEITQDEGIVVGEGKNGIEVRQITSLAGRRRRDVDVEDDDVGVVDGGLDCDDFGVGVVDEGGINGGVGDGVVDEESHSTPPTPTLSVLIDERVSWDGRKTGVVEEFRLLDCGDADLVFVEEVAEIVDFTLKTVAVPL